MGVLYLTKSIMLEYRKFGKTNLEVSSIGFGAWGIGGPSMAGDIPIGWGKTDDRQSTEAIKKALDRGINFFDTADIYGVGHSEELIGRTLGNRPDVIIATKAGNIIDANGNFSVNYTRNHILRACESSLKRLKRETIDYYQLHSARLDHLQRGECIEAMEQLQKEGKIRYWGLSLNTFSPEPEADFLMEHKSGYGFQIVLNLINQRGLALIKKAHAAGYGIIARMPLQFGLLTGKFTKDTRFEKNDHRHFRLPPPLLARSLDDLQPVFKRAEALGMSKTAYALSYILSYPEVSTVIPGIKTPEQAVSNTSGICKLPAEELTFLENYYEEKLISLLTLIEKQG
jgi:aryl-alcohol dehydrogenase-like predicted oxidoreductase